MRRFYLYQVLENKQIEEINPNESRDFLREIYHWVKEIKEEEVYCHLIISEPNKYFLLYVDRKYYIIDDYLQKLNWEITNIDKNYLRFLNEFKDILGKDKIKDLFKKSFCICYIPNEKDNYEYTFLRTFQTSFPT